MRSAKWRAAGIAALALVVLATARSASAQDKPAAPAAPQEDILKFSTSVPTLLIIQVHADKAADFESAWATIRGGFGKVKADDQKAFGETLAKFYKLDQPPMDSPGGKAVVYILQIDAPSTTYSYNPAKIIYDILWDSGKDGAAMTRAEADEIYKKIAPVFQSITPWKLAKIG